MHFTQFAESHNAALNYSVIIFSFSMSTILMFHTVLYLLAELCSRQSEPHCGVLCLYQQHSVFVGVCPLDHAFQHFTLCVCVAGTFASDDILTMWRSCKPISCCDELYFTVNVSPVSLLHCSPAVCFKNRRESENKLTEIRSMEFEWAKRKMFSL